MKSDSPTILLIYTGGTIGMMENPETGALENFNLEQLKKHVPELERLDFVIDTYTFEPPIDSSDMDTENWCKLVEIISSNYDYYNGFVILHGTDTMAYTASALSFMLEGLRKPVILTGSQLPIGVLRTDGKENLLTSLEIAAASLPDGSPMVPEVCIFFENLLMRGNRTTKINAEDFNAFRSFNYPALATAGIHIKYNQPQIHYQEKNSKELTRHQVVHGSDFREERKDLKPHFLLDNNLTILRLFPGISQRIVEAVLHTPGLKAVVLGTFGSGNAPSKPWFLNALKEATDRGIVIVNVTQCDAGSVEMERYETGYHLMQAGVVSGYDITIEAAITKLMFLLGHHYSPDEVRHYMTIPLAGKFTR